MASVVGPVGEAVFDDADPFRLRLLDGLATSIGERGYRATTVADIVRHARTSKRTFYDQFAGKEQCFLELLHADNEKLGQSIRAAVDPEADWHLQIADRSECQPGLSAC
jgi:AcrR family transcriptional regulator